MKSPKIGQVSGMNNFEAMLGMSLLLIYLCVIVSPTMRKVYARPWKNTKEGADSVENSGSYTHKE